MKGTTMKNIPHEIITNGKKEIIYSVEWTEKETEEIWNMQSVYISPNTITSSQLILMGQEQRGEAPNISGDVAFDLNREEKLLPKESNPFAACNGNCEQIGYDRCLCK